MNDIAEAFARLDSKLRGVPSKVFCRSKQEHPI